MIRLFISIVILLSVTSCSKSKKYTYVSVELSTSLFGDVETKESEPEIIKAETDSVAYLIALEKFYILDKIKKDVGEYSGVSLSRLVEFKLLNEDGINIVNTLNFKNKDSIENSIREEIFNSSNFLDKKEESDLSLVDSIKIKELLPFFTIKKDEFDPRDIVYYKPKSSPKYINRNGFYFYFKTQGGQPKNLIFAHQYYAGDWLFIKKIQLSIDGRPFEYIPSNVETDSGDGMIWEWFDETVRIEDKELIESLYLASSVKVKLIGSQYSDVVTLTKNQIQDIGRSLDFYFAMGGKLPFKIDEEIKSKKEFLLKKNSEKEEIQRINRIETDKKNKLNQLKLEKQKIENENLWRESLTKYLNESGISVSLVTANIGNSHVGVSLDGENKIVGFGGYIEVTFSKGSKYRMNYIGSTQFTNFPYFKIDKSDIADSLVRFLEKTQLPKNELLKVDLIIESVNQNSKLFELNRSLSPSIFSTSQKIILREPIRIECKI